MEITLHSQDIRITEAMEEFARQKLERLDRYLPNISEIRLDLTREHTRRGEDIIAAQITVRHQRGAILRTEERYPGDPQIALNLALDKMYHRIERFKGKRSRKGGERFSATIEELDIAEQAPDASSQEIHYADIEDAIDQPLIARRKALDLMPMSEGEAVDQMELLGHTFFIFANAETRAINVIYKRHDGSYGLIVPKLT
jgi:putative sigma-54 modulation protein